MQLSSSVSCFIISKFTNLYLQLVFDYKLISIGKVMVGRVGEGGGGLASGDAEQHDANRTVVSVVGVGKFKLNYLK